MSHKRYAVLVVSNFLAQSMDIPQMLVDIDVTVIAQENNAMRQTIDFLVERSDFAEVEHGNVYPRVTVELVDGSYSLVLAP